MGETPIFQEDIDSWETIMFLYNSALNTDYDATKGIYSDLINGIIDECEFEELLEDVINGDY